MNLRKQLRNHWVGERFSHLLFTLSCRTRLDLEDLLPVECLSDERSLAHLEHAWRVHMPICTGCSTLDCTFVWCALPTSPPASLPMTVMQDLVMTYKTSHLLQVCMMAM